MNVVDVSSDSQVGLRGCVDCYCGRRQRATSHQFCEFIQKDRTDDVLNFDTCAMLQKRQ